MPYKKSQARKSFDIEIDKMILVIRSTFSNKTTASDTKNYVLSSCVMLGTAKIEVYFEDLIDGWINKVNLAGLNSSHLPNSLKAVYINQPFLSNAFKRFIVDSNESNFIDSIIGQLNNHHFHLTDNVKIIPRLDPKKIYQNKKYPSPDNLKTLFKRIGVNNVFNELNRSARADLQNVLQSFNDFRTAIAHNGIPAGINDRDVIEKLKSIKGLIYHVDKTLFKHINRHTTIATWAA
ncbi:MAG TPA: HEPN domain-containing protein [Cyclobacteriaceae bacterium]|nr:HEPN domain-containing protein [Cyclobacteriaceae bacterium]